MIYDVHLVLQHFLHPQAVTGDGYIFLLPLDVEIRFCLDTFCTKYSFSEHRG